ncbi:MAG: molecular chaperone Hsp33 [Alphaproteobacteria bacterium]|nr:molecular chaperone Hsp33 [Alphaproteobacteria bacterium]
MTVPDNILQPFQLENHAAQGRLVRLGDAMHCVLTAHDYPAEVARLLGEVQVIASLMSGTLKFDGVLSIQLKGEGPVSMVLVDVTTDGDMRGYARFDSKKLEAISQHEANGPQQDVPRLLGNGYFALTVDQGPDTQPYQGVVSLEGATLAECAHSYLRQSAQLEAALKVVVSQVDDEDDEKGSTWRGGGIMVQKSAFSGFQSIDGEASDADFEDAWRRAVIFLGSSTNDELLDPSLHPHDFLFRLFSEDGVRAFDPSPFAMKCRCSADRVQNVLVSFPREEIESMKIGEDVVVTCEFCNVDYRFDADHINTIFKESASG